ncbi:MAG TPA: ACP S-malonyltransferase [Actinomycetota bacterium]|nr:ACP S-malonyltransferase [Actinomycetota bacterium]
MRAGLFPGQGLDPRTVASSLPNGHQLLERANEVLGYDVQRRVEQVARSSGPVLRTDLAQPAIFMGGIISFREATERGEQFDYLAGHSLGEYTALVAGGSIPFDHGLRLVAARGMLMQRASTRSTGGMAAVMNLAFDDAEAICAETGVVLANDNSPSQVVLSGSEEALSRAALLVRGLGGRTVRLPVEAAYHSPAMQPSGLELAAVLDRTEIRSPAIPVLSNVSALPYRAPGEIRKLLVHQLTGRVRFRQSVSWLIESGVTEFFDLGPGRVVGRLAEATVRARNEVIRA